jgi:4-amino-4-deoxy-L-arabinose transferase-like glycosyltransferase
LRARAKALAQRLFIARFDDGAGLPPAERLEILAGRALATLATLWILGVVLWEIAAPFGAGHYAAATAVTTGGENMLRFGIVGPVPRVLAEPPSPGDYYCHHPWGVFWVAAFFVGLFGHHDVVCRLPAALMSSAMPVLLYGAGRALWGPLAGGLSAAAYVALPITLAYANFFALEVPTMFAMALTAFAFVRFRQTDSRRFAALTVVGFALAASFDWTGFVFGGFVLGALFLRGFVFRRFFPPLPFDRFASVWAIGVVVLALLLAFHLGEFAHLGQLGHFFAQGEARATGSSEPLSKVLESRRYWILLAFTPLAIVLGKVALPVLLGRLAILRRDAEIVPLAVLFTATFQYLAFKQGADIHFFWPQYFALYFAYALGGLAVTASEGSRYLAGRFGRAELARPLNVSIHVALVVVVLLLVPDALRALEWARKSGGRFNEKGLIIHPDLDKSRVFTELSKTLPESSSLAVDPSMKPSYWMDFTLERPVNVTSFPAGRGRQADTHFAFDSRFSAKRTLASSVREHAVSAYGPYFIVDLEAPEKQPIKGFAVQRQEPTFFERVFVQSSHALYRVRPDPFWTWELRSHLGELPNPLPSVNPHTFSELRIAHNVAVSLGDRELAARRRDALLRGVANGSARDFTQGVRLLGVRFEHGASDVLTVYFEAAAPLASDVGFVITSEVEKGPRFSLVPADELVWNVGMPFSLPTSLWRAGYVYESVTELMRRPGRERYVGWFDGPGAPTPTSGPRETTLLVLE